MMETALSIVQSYRRRVNLDDAPSTLLSLTNPEDLQDLEFLYDVLKDLRRKGPFRQQLQKHEFATIANQSRYPLPGDFFEALPETYYNQDSDWQLIGPLTDAAFNAFKEGERFVPTEYVWRIAGFDENSASTEGQQFEIYPTPSAVENLAIEYAHGNLFVPPNWAASTAYTSGEYVNVNGRIYLCDTNGTSGSTPPSGTDANQSDGTTQWDWYDQPYDTVIADEDLCIFDANVVKLGMRAMYYGEDNAAIAQKAERDFRGSIVSMRQRLQGKTRIRGDRRTSRRRIHRPYIQPGSWSIV